MENRVTKYFYNEEKEKSYSDLCRFMAALLKHNLVEISFGPSPADEELEDFSFFTNDEQHEKLKELFTQEGFDYPDE